MEKAKAIFDTICLLPIMLLLFGAFLIHTDAAGNLVFESAAERTVIPPNYHTVDGPWTHPKMTSYDDIKFYRIELYGLKTTLIAAIPNGMNQFVVGTQHRSNTFRIPEAVKDIIRQTSNDDDDEYVQIVVSRTVTKRNRRAGGYWTYGVRKFFNFEPDPDEDIDFNFDNAYFKPLLQIVNTDMEIRKIQFYGYKGTEQQPRDGETIEKIENNPGTLIDIPYKVTEVNGTGQIDFVQVVVVTNAPDGRYLYKFQNYGRDSHFFGNPDYEFRKPIEFDFEEAHERGVSRNANIEGPFSLPPAGNN